MTFFLTYVYHDLEQRPYIFILFVEACYQARFFSG